MTEQGPKPQDQKGDKEEALKLFHFYMENPDQVTLDYTEKWPAYLNNFYGHFPIPKEFRGEVFSNRYDEKRSSLNKITLRECLGELEKKYGWGKTDPRWSPSTLKLDQTSEEFYETLDSILYSLYPNYNDLYTKAREEIIKEEVESGELFVVPRKLPYVLLEVFKRMRAMGYNQYDLTA